MNVIPSDVAAIAWKTKVDDLTTDRKALVRYARALRALQKSLREHGMDVSVAENNAVWNEVVEAYEELSRELRDEISEDV